MTDDLQRLVAEARRTGTLDGLPDRLAIGGAWRPAAGGAAMDTVDPGTGRAFAAVPAGEAADVDAAVDAAGRALPGWRAALPAERGRVLARAAARLAAAADRFAVVECLDSGKPLAQARGDVAGVVRCLEYYAGACDKLHGETLPIGPGHLAWTELEPVGVTAHVVPWNYPLSTLARGIVPALAAGCTVVAKPAEQTPLTALMLAALLDAAGLPGGAFNVVTGTGAAAGAPLVAHPGVAHVTFTGSVATGIGVMQAAARNVTRVTLELGGKSPVIVLADADREAAVEGVLGAIYENAGQICSAGSRLIVERAIHAEMVDALAARAASLTLGHGLTDPGVGPVISARQQARIAGHVEAARARGVEVVTGGAAIADPETGLGWFYAPTILDRVAPGDPAGQDEIFGPVLAVHVVDSAEEAVAVANGTDYALVAGIYTRDFAAAHRLARAVDAGQVFVNEYFAGGIEVPFGGNRKSGFGREKGMEGMRGYCTLKSVAARL